MAGWLERHREAAVAVAFTLMLAALALSAVLFVVRRPQAAPIVIREMTPLPTQSRAPTATPSPIRVYVSGAVARPGVYALAWDSRAEQALAAAGGASAEADLTLINLAQRVYDEQQVHVPVRGEPATPAPPPSAPYKSSTAALLKPGQKVNINTADLSQLDLLPGIGPALAQRIVDYRQANGPFARPDDIKKVKGIGDSIYEQLQELITVE
jgi:competence protein ComEA